MFTCKAQFTPQSDFTPTKKIYIYGMETDSLVGKTLPEIEAVIKKLGFSPSLAKDVLVSIYKKRCKAIESIQTLPLPLRHALSEQFKHTGSEPQRMVESVDGTWKYLFRTHEGYPFETAFMPGGKRNTLCISTQSGCGMGCKFCHTGSMGFNSNLSAMEMLSQLLRIPEGASVNRVVFMGMGEPLDNIDQLIRTLEVLTAQWGFALGAASITVSTVGLLPSLIRLVESKRCNVAVSLHSPWPDKRLQLIPAEFSHPIGRTIEYLRRNGIQKPLRLSFEYVVIPGVNDSIADVGGVVALLRGLNAHVNVIALNSEGSSEANLRYARIFQELLNQQGQPATLRLPRGVDIGAACGMLSAEGGIGTPTFH